MNSKLLRKLKKLKKFLKEMDSCVLAYSGGVDSTLLLRIAKEVLGSQLLAVTARSEAYPKEELEFAKSFADNLGARHKIIKTSELKDKKFIRNSPQRCFYCKRILFSRLKRIAQKSRIKNVIDAANASDKFDFRPGKKAAKTIGVRSPLEEAGLNKQDIYALSRYFNLPTKSKPSLACLASRFPYGEKITKGKLLKVNNMELFIRALGVGQIRFRHHNNLARIEVCKKDFNRIIKHKSLIVEKAKALGYNYISLDLQGYRTGSMNEAIRK